MKSLLRPASARNCAGFAVICFLLGLALRSQASDAVDDFKQFMASPPAIESLIFGIKVADRSHVLAGPEGWTNYQYYTGRWQTNAWLLRPIESPRAKGSMKIWSSAAFVFGDGYWHLHPSGVADFWLDERGVGEGVGSGLPSPGTSPVERECMFRKVNLSQILNMGILNIEPGTIRWEGDDFHAYYPERQQTISGRLTLSQSGVPNSLAVTYQSGTNVAQYVIRYGFERDPGLRFIPSEFRTFQLVQGREIERLRAQIHEIKLAVKPLPKGDFNPAAYIDFNHLAVRRFTNGMMLALDKRGRWVMATSGPLGEAFGRPSPQFFYASVSVLALTFVVLMWRARKEATLATEEKTKG